MIVAQPPSPLRLLFTNLKVEKPAAASGLLPAFAGPGRGGFPNTGRAVRSTFCLA